MTAADSTLMEGRGRWLALWVLCLGDLMIVLDGTIVNVALPSIRDDLGFSETSLAWVVNGYLLTFGGFLLLGGRLGDLFGQRKLFLIGIGIFTFASLGCGLSTTQELLIGMRALQGLGGALVSAVALSLVMTLFVEPADRAKAMGIFGFVLSGGGVAGVLLGGVLTDVLNWHWIFLVNIPVGALVFVLSLRLLPAVPASATGRLDLAGAVTVTAALILAVYAIVNGNDTGWLTAETLGLLGAAVFLLATFLTVEARIASPLVPLSLFRNGSVSAANVAGVLMAAGLFAYFFFSALYMQQVLGWSPLEVGLAYLPSMVLWGASSLYSDKLVMRFGIKPPLLTGLGLMALSLVLFARVPVGGEFLTDVLPPTLAVGLGAGIAFNPLLLAAMSGVSPQQAGLASGVVNTAFMMGGALGLAILASLADWRTGSLRDSGDTVLAATNGGYHSAFILGAAFALAAAGVAAVLLRTAPAGELDAHGEPAAAAAPD
jgi:EmrB/QacA subfamily drug resistance transporter